MTEHSNIDELLNSFLDGELPSREHTELQRMLSHDRHLAERLRELRQCKMLLGSLPSAEAPPGMAERIKASLRTTAPSAATPEGFDRRKGARHLLARRVLANAAMIALIAVLGAVIYTIVSPPATETDKRIAAETQVPPAEKIGPAEPAAGPVVAVEHIEKPVAEPVVAMEFNGTLEVRTAARGQADAFISDAIEDNGLSQYASLESFPDRTVYTLNCSRKALNSLLVDLQGIWTEFDSTALYLETDRTGGQVVVNAVNAAQLARIAGQESLEKRIRIAKDFAVWNNIAELLPGKELLLLAAEEREKPDLITIPGPAPEPRLTRPEETVKKPDSETEDRQNVHLTIVVVSSE